MKTNTRQQKEGDLSWAHRLGCGSNSSDREVLLATRRIGTRLSPHSSSNELRHDRNVEGEGYGDVIIDRVGNAPNQSVHFGHERPGQTAGTDKGLLE